MELIKLTNEEFDDYALSYDNVTFMQNSIWGEFKKINGWDYELLGVKKNKKIKAACLLLSKNTPLRKKIFYAIRGYLLDYKDTELFEEFDKLITDYAKKHNGLFLKIDPYVIYHQRDNDGQIVENGIDNTKFVKRMKELGYKAQNTRKNQHTLQIDWMYWIDLKGKSFDEIMNNMTSKTRQMIRKNEKKGVEIREGTIEDIDEFYKIMDHTSERRGFSNRPKEYLEKMYKAFGNGKYLKLIFADLCVEKKLNEFKASYEIVKKDYDNTIKDIESGKKKIGENKLKLKEDEVNRIEKDIEEYQNLYEKYGSKITLGGIFYFMYGKEVLSFIGGAYDEFLEFQPFYTIHYEMIKYAKENGYDYYNFYGIPNGISKDDKQYGIYLFKKGFGGEVVELIGEYDKKISHMYKLYKGLYGVYKIKNKLHTKTRR